MFQLGAEDSSNSGLTLSSVQVVSFLKRHVDEHQVISVPSLPSVDDVVVIPGRVGRGRSSGDSPWDVVAGGALLDVTAHETGESSRQMGDKRKREEEGKG